MLNGSVLKMGGGYLLIGTRDGSIDGYDPRTNRKVFSIKGTSKAPVRDIVWLNNRPWWITEGSPFLHGCSHDAKPINIDPSDLKIGPIRRLGSWQGMLSIHSDTKLRFMEPGTRHILTPEEALPKDVATAAQQGELLMAPGLLVTLRHVGNRSRTDSPGGISDIALINGWSVVEENRAILLGGSTASVVAFRETDGARVDLDLGGVRVDRPHGAADVGNVRVLPEGLVALLGTGLIAIPSTGARWEAIHVPMPVSPNYTDLMDMHSGIVWWSDGKTLYQTKLADGSTLTHSTPGDRSEVTSVVADGLGSYVLTEDGRVTRAFLQSRPGNSASRTR